MPRLAIIAATLALACGPAPADEPTSTSASTSTDAPTTAPPIPTTGATTTTESTTDHVSFINPPDHPVHKDPCQTYKQDCPPGQKCIPWAPTPGPWSNAKCVDVTGDQAPGEPCTAPDGITGLDDCALGSICWGLDEAGHGTCARQCAGTPDNPICPLKTSCGSDQYSVLALCFAHCEPLLQDCPRGDSCLPIGQAFDCFTDASGEEGQANDPCESYDFCDPGLVCTDAASASNACDQGFEKKCCQPFCEFPDGPCPNADQQCLPLESTPPGYANLGLCARPD